MAGEVGRIRLANQEGGLRMWPKPLNKDHARVLFGGYEIKGTGQDPIRDERS